MSEISLLWKPCLEKNLCLLLFNNSVSEYISKGKLALYYERELVKFTSKHGVEINKAIEFPHLAGPVKFLSGLGHTKSKNLLESLTSGNPTRIESRERISILYKTSDPSMNHEFLPFIKVKTSLRTDTIAKDPLESLVIHNNHFEYARSIIKTSYLFNPSLSFEENLKIILTNSKNPNNPPALSLNYSKLNLKKISDENVEYTKYTMQSIVEELNQSNKTYGQAFQEVKFSDILKAGNFQLKEGKLVTGTVIGIEKSSVIKVKLFRNIIADLNINNILFSDENKKMKKLKKIKKDDLICTRILKINEEQNSLDLCFIAKDFFKNNKNNFKTNIIHERYRKTEKKLTFDFSLIQKKSRTSNIDNNNNNLNLNNNKMILEDVIDESKNTSISSNLASIGDGDYAYNYDKFYLRKLLLKNKIIFSEKCIQDNTKVFNINYSTAKDLLINQSLNFNSDFELANWPFIFCLSEKNTFCSNNKPEILCCLKISEDKFWRLKISLIDKSSNNPALESNIIKKINLVDYKLQLDERIFESLDDFMQNYLFKVVGFIRILSLSRKFSDHSNIENLKTRIESLTKKYMWNEYSYCLFPQYPKYCLLCYYLNSIINIEYIEISPEGFKFYNQTYLDIDDLSTWFKKNIKDPNFHAPDKQYTLQELEKKIRDYDPESEENPSLIHTEKMIVDEELKQQNELNTIDDNLGSSSTIRIVQIDEIIMKIDKSKIQENEANENQKLLKNKRKRSASFKCKEKAAEADDNAKEKVIELKTTSEVDLVSEIIKDMQNAESKNISKKINFDEMLNLPLSEEGKTPNFEKVLNCNDNSNTKNLENNTKNTDLLLENKEINSIVNLNSLEEAKEKTTQDISCWGKVVNTNSSIDFNQSNKNTESTWGSNNPSDVLMTIDDSCSGWENTTSSAFDSQTTETNTNTNDNCSTWGNKPNSQFNNKHNNRNNRSQNFDKNFNQRKSNDWNKSGEFNKNFKDKNNNNYKSNYNTSNQDCQDFSTQSNMAFNANQSEANNSHCNGNNNRWNNNRNNFHNQQQQCSPSKNNNNRGFNNNRNFNKNSNDFSSPNTSNYNRLGQSWGNNTNNNRFNNNSNKNSENNFNNNPVKKTDDNNTNNNMQAKTNAENSWCHAIPESDNKGKNISEGWGNAIISNKEAEFNVNNMGSSRGNADSNTNANVETNCEWGNAKNISTNSAAVDSTINNENNNNSGWGNSDTNTNNKDCGWGNSTANSNPNSNDNKTNWNSQKCSDSEANKGGFNKRSWAGKNHS